jgi:hypothetical protein
MRRTGLLSALALGLCSAVAASGQPGAAGALPAALRAHLQADRFEIVTSVRGLPLGVRDQLQTLFATGTLDIADPGAPYQGSDPAAGRQLPSRRLVAAGCAVDFHCLVYYERSGTARTWHVLLFHWSPAATRVEWGGAAPRGLATVEDVRKAALSGAITRDAGFW